MEPRKTLSSYLEEIIELEMNKSITNEYKELNEKCDLIIEKIKKRKQMKEKAG